MDNNQLIKLQFGIVFAILIVLSVSSGCLDSHETEPKQILRIGISPAVNQLDLLESFEPVRMYLENELGMEVETFSATDYTSVIEAMRSDKIDAAFFGPFSYILATENAGAEAIITGATKNGEVKTYHSYLITHQDSGIRSIEDLKNNSSEITFAFVDPASMSGNLIPRGYLFSIGINPDKDFKASMFAGGHDATALAVKSKKVDVGATFDIGYNRLIDSGAITREEVIVIWKSDPIPTDPVAVRGNLDPELKKKVQQAFVDMSEKDPEAMKTFESKWGGNERYIAINDSTYEYVRELAKSLGYI